MARDLDDRGFFSGLARVVQATGAAGGIVAHLAKQKMGIQADSFAHAEALKQTLGNLRGPLMKVGQILAAIPGILPQDYVDELVQLQAHAPPMGWNFVKRRMAAELGAGWQKHFQSFDKKASFAASLGQVHKAVLKDGRTVACKLQYPDMPSVVKSDLRQLKIAVGIYHQLDNAIRQDDVVEELASRLYEELDYLREAANMRLYHAIFADHHDITVPQPIDDLCTKRLLTMEWVEGKDFNQIDFSQLSEEQKISVAQNLFRAWYIPLYQYGVVHGDPHMGNFTLREDGGINLLDFGAIRIFEANFIKGNIALYKALGTGDEHAAEEAYKDWGFTDLNPSKVKILNKWAMLLFSPLLTDRTCYIQADNSPAQGRETLSQVHEGLQKAGGVRLPREFVFVDRSALGLGAIFIRLKIKMNWHRLFQEIIAGFAPQDLAQRQKDVVYKARYPEV